MHNASQVARAIQGALGQYTPYINTQMAQVGPYELNVILDYYKKNPAGSDYPMIMMNHIKFNNYWIALQNMVRTVYQFDIYGLIRGSGNPEQLDRTADLMAGAVSDVLNSVSMSLQLEDGTIITYLDGNGNGYVPISEATFVQEMPEEIITRGFKARWKGSVEWYAPDINAYSNSLAAPGNQI